jgi:hypothetical protein
MVVACCSPLVALLWPCVGVPVLVVPEVCVCAMAAVLRQAAAIIAISLLFMVLSFSV